MEGQNLPRFINITEYEQFVKAFYAQSGLDLNYYKENQMKRRINNFMTTHGHKDNYSTFLQALSTDSKLYDAFFKHLTINVSQFFRDVKLWDIYREKILPDLLRSSLRSKFGVQAVQAARKLILWPLLWRSISLG
jgi:chemotaxis protein methyltransferase CheR